MSAAVLIAVVCKTGLVAALALSGAALLRARPARERVVLLRLGLVLVAALPLISQQIPSLRIEAPAALSRPAAAPAAQPAPVLAPPAVEAPADAAALAPSPPPASQAIAPAPGLLSPWVLLAAVYAAGAGLLLLRLAIGVAVLIRRTREASPVEDARWLAALERAAGSGPRPQLKVSSRPLAPLSWGLRPGVILIGPDAVAQPERADAVLTHELAHIRHGDWPFLMLSRLLVAVFWLNPLVWLLERELTRQSEHAADAWAVRRVPRLDYAGALVALARSGRTQGLPGAVHSAALGMADSELAKRVKTVLDARAFGGRPWPTAAAAIACVGFAGPLAALELAPAAAGEPPRPQPRPAAAAAPSAARDFAPGNVQPSAVAAPVPIAAPAPSGSIVPGVANLENAAAALVASADRLRAQAMNPNLRPDERARLQHEAAAVEARASHMRMQAGSIAARHAVQAQSQAQAEAQVAMRGQLDVTVDVRLDPMAGAFIGAADMRNAADQMRADAAGMDAHADNLARGDRLGEGGEAQVEALHGQAEGLREQADELDRQADAVGPP
ncbi:M56 family metallopeptidase [Brevundimonas sp. Root1279]|uniref:M56 family metallopeptidase n=1 Tax=Brevundimonas sp. Root1279 TaxID=1736443 RepID=UPI0006F4BD7E|nr:M56 family metallopeptidase [Brevundimonas sp. Root1279]KQW82292.1 hypothetical protein ASC65_08445 [Brevundimonas sp. Root1279]